MCSDRDTSLHETTAMENLSEGSRLMVYLAVASSVKLLAAYKAIRTRRTRRQVGRVSGLTVFPIKSARGIHVEQAECLKAGLKLMESPVADRYWMIVNDNNGYIALLQTPKVALISVEVSGDGLLLSAPNQDVFRLPICQPNAKEVSVSLYGGDQVLAVDCGDAISEWLEPVIGQIGVRLVYHAPHLTPTVRSGFKHLMEPEDAVAFAYSTAILLTSEASLADLNSRLKEKVLMETMRTNITVEGCDAYSEDEWVKSSIGQVEFEKVKLCNRCTTINVDITKGEKYQGDSPLGTLRKYRPMLKEYKNSPTLGIKYKVVTPGIIKVGDPVYVWE